MPTGDHSAGAPHQRSRTRGWWTAGALGLAVCAVSLGINSGASPRADNPNAVEPTTEQLANAQIALEAQMESGFVPYTDEVPYVGEPVTGWLPVGQMSLPDYDLVEHRVPVYAAPDKETLIGFDYTYIGFVQLETIELDAFNAASVRRGAFGGCDPLDPGETPESCPVSRWTKPRSPDG